jgi:hypothetical protein
MPKPRSFEENHGVTKLAQQAGVSVTTVSHKLRQGKTPAQILDEAAAWKEKDVKQRKPGGNESFTEAQTRKETALADLRELELSEKRGELVNLVEVNAWVSGMILRARDILLRIGPELRDRLSKEADPITIQGLIDGEIKSALAELSCVSVRVL